MKKLFLDFCSQGLKLVLLLLILSSAAWGEDRFVVTVGPHDNLIIFGPKGDRVAELNVPTVAQPVTVGSDTFQVSYGRDTNNALTAVFAPSSGNPVKLHFTVLNKNIDADSAVVTLTFSSNLNRVAVDPGYIGSVQVNSQNLRLHSLADDSTTPIAPRTVTTTTTAVASTPPARAPQPATITSTDVPARDVPASHPIPAPPSFSSVPASAPAPAQSSPPAQEKPVVAADKPNPPADPLAGTLVNVEATRLPRFWAEPITPPNGHPPSIALDQIKLLQVQGPVSVKMPDGNTVAGTNGMTVPSGSLVTTLANGSAALFMGGVNSARFMPDSEAQVQQQFDGSIRKTSIDLRAGTVFSRVGRRKGEKQDYQVRTPEGVAAARGTIFADHRSANHHHYVFVVKGTVELMVEKKIYKILKAQTKEIESGVMPPTDDTDAVFEQIMEVLQPFNTTIQEIFQRIANGTATTADMAYYHDLRNVFYELIYPGLGDHDYYPNMGGIIPYARRALDQDLEPFGTNPLTPY